VRINFPVACMELLHIATAAELFDRRNRKRIPAWRIQI
jgi:hypothetical protein